MYVASFVSWKHLKCHWYDTLNTPLSSFHKDLQALVQSLSLRSVWDIFKSLDIRTLVMVSFKQISDPNTFPGKAAEDEAQK